MSSPDFASMSNEELRQQMEKFGLPKVPITASTRNILIKRLQNHLAGGKAASSKSRLSHAVRYSSDDDSDRDSAKEKLKKKMENHKNARRQTIAVPAVARPVVTPTPPVAAEKPSRKSMRATPTKTTRESGIQPPSKHLVRTTTIPVTIEDSDEEIIEVPVKRASVVDRRSKSKTPTLAKSDLITTSYKQVVGTVQEDEAEEEEEEASDDDSARHPEAIPAKDSPVRPMSVRISPLRRTTLASGQFRYEPSSASGRASDYVSSYGRPSAVSATTSSYASTYASSSSKYATATTDQGVEDADFPMLRDFSKRLSSLKAEPLHKRYSPSLTTSATTRTSSYGPGISQSRSSAYRGVATRPRESHFYDPIVQFLADLEQRFALKRKILMLLAILVVIFVLVMFFY